jgi:hypothetical protein
MSAILDKRFIDQCSIHLERFSWKSETRANCRCPICGDSQKNKNKARGYFFKGDNAYFYKCHNCGASHNILGFLNTVDPELAREYRIEQKKDEWGVGTLGSGWNAGDRLQTAQRAPQKLSTSAVLSHADPISTLSDIHPGKAYILNRKIPEQCWDEIYYTDDFRAVVANLNEEKAKTLRSNEPRIVIPYLDRDRNIFGVSGRALDPKALRYISVRREDSQHPNFVGMHRWNPDHQGYLCEGVFDSFFLPNSLAMSGAHNLRNPPFDNSKMTVVLDNEPRNYEICKLYNKLITNDYRIVIWKSNPPFKDINEAILGGWTPKRIRETIDKYTYGGMRARMEFQSWKKC